AECTPHGASTVRAPGLAVTSYRCSGLPPSLVGGSQVTVTPPLTAPARRLATLAGGDGRADVGVTGSDGADGGPARPSPSMAVSVAVYWVPLTAPVTVAAPVEGCSDTRTDCTVAPPVGRRSSQVTVTAPLAGLTEGLGAV